MIPRRKLRRPDSRSTSSSFPLSVDCRETGLKSSLETVDSVDIRLTFVAGVSRGVAGEGGMMPLKARNEPPGATCVSVRIMRRRRPGAGLLGAVEGGATRLRSASSRM